MSEWLGRPRLKKEDIEKWQPSLVKHYPTLTRYFVDTQKLRMTLVLEHEDADKFIAAVKKKYKKMTPANAQKALMEALNAWVEKSK